MGVTLQPGKMRKEGNVLFNDTLNTFFITVMYHQTTKISLLPFCGLLFSISSQWGTYHSLRYIKQWLVQETAELVNQVGLNWWPTVPWADTRSEQHPAPWKTWEVSHGWCDKDSNPLLNQLGSSLTKSSASQLSSNLSTGPQPRVRFLKTQWLAYSL